MVTGVVNGVLEGVISLPVQDAQGQWHDGAAVVETAFTRWLTLPLAQINSLGLIWKNRVQGMLADGTILYFDVYKATVIWDGRTRTIEVDASEVFPLVGMRLMSGFQLRIDVVVGGAVEIEELPVSRP